MDNPMDPLTDQRLRRLEEKGPTYDRRLRALETRITNMQPIVDDTHTKVDAMYELFITGKTNGKVIAWLAVVVAAISTFMHYFLDWFNR